jgi:hypothetical protein
MDKFKEINELVKPENIDLSSFKVKDSLSPKFWVKDKNGAYKIKENIKSRLLLIADDFFEYLDIPWVDIEDIILTGSIANYNWSQFSDIDLHIVFSYKEVDTNLELVTEYLTSKKNLWNNKHDIKIYGHDVELYAQDPKEPHHSTGIYSLLWDKWNIKPKPGKHYIDHNKIKKKSSTLMVIIDNIEKMYQSGNYEKVIRKVEKTLERIKDMRSAGLEGGGEYSTENLTFKVLRREGYIEKLMDLKDKSYDKSLTLK